MSSVGRKMHGLLVEVVATATVWERVSDVLGELEKANLPGIDPDALRFAEAQAYESLVRAVLLYADEYRGFEQIERALHGDPWGPTRASETGV